MSLPSQRFALAFVCVLIGSVLGATLPRLAAQTVPSPPRAVPQWQQFCDRPAYTTAAVNANLRQRGAEGFELVSVSFPQGSTTLWTCFKRPASL
jgi:hypothetical protein